jgi:Tfp pilus assembly pilus retraction ATPase PilT
MTKRSIHIDRLLEAMLKSTAMELRLSIGSPPRLYVDGQYQNVTGRDIERDDIKQLMRSITPDALQQELRVAEQVKFSFNFGDQVRLYCRIDNWHTNPEIVIRPPVVG